jgi:hypothetical protein
LAHRDGRRSDGQPSLSGHFFPFSINSSVVREIQLRRYIKEVRKKCAVAIWINWACGHALIWERPDEFVRVTRELLSTVSDIRAEPFIAPPRFIRRLI